MKRIRIALFVILAAALILAVGCQKEEAAAPVQSPDESSSMASGYQDGFYFAQEDSFSERTGWKYMALLEVKDGKIVEAVWNGANVNSGYDKVYQSENGMYGMVENGGAQAPWYEQAAKVEAALIEAQDPSAISYDSDGYTDAISGVSIHINEFIELAEEALAQGPVGRGPYKDGYYHAELDEFNRGWKDYVDVTVIGGYIVAVHWSAYPEEGELDKYQFSREGQYGMVENGGAQDPWWVQVDRAEAYLLETQDPAQIEYVDEDGHVDAISGVSIHVKELFSLAEKALAEAK